ncbi:kynurenine--oxoglutarate transaminase 3 [Bradysia coprophila]|uniref:kynurenine--oxoglutarate transaminase 3 n=1 Tax=Bradysia coprophila TaxID=38358 RepID=UPI00187DBD4B|nr:kynurenine--oxoglutarate transaminase 3 [Bradysia coprophila]
MIASGKAMLISHLSLSIRSRSICNVFDKIVRPYQSITSNRNMSQSADSVNKKFDLPARLQGSTKSVWNEYIQLAQQYKPLNLGQGFTDYPVPSYITKAMATTANSDNPLLHQYTRGFGHLRLVQAISKLYTKLVQRPVDAQNEVLITCGAYEALYSAILGHVDVGDEVIIIEPFFDCYEPMVKMAGGIPRFIPLKPKHSNVTSSADWVLDDDELEKIFNNKTKMFILNNPNNPLGKVFTAAELRKIADLCIKYNVLCLSDEVYEWMIYDNNKFIRICTLDGMWDRTITIGSAGKTFSVTGWKIGWAYAAASLIVNMQMVHQNSVFTSNTPTQEALAIAFETELPRLGTKECYFDSLPEELRLKRDFMAEFLTKAGMTVTLPEGGYFMIADWTQLENKCDLTSETDVRRDYRFTKWMIKNLGLQGIPPSAFYSEDHKHLGENYVRYCFFKKDENLQKASDILSNWK